MRRRALHFTPCTMRLALPFARAIALFCVLALLAFSSSEAALPSNASIIFLHHSTGGGVWGDGNVESHMSAYNAEHGTNYAITEFSYPNTP